jgi:hypothetical protein
VEKIGPAATATTNGAATAATAGEVQLERSGTRATLAAAARRAGGLRGRVALAAARRGRTGLRVAPAGLLGSVLAVRAVIAACTESRWTRKAPAAATAAGDHEGCRR